MRSQLRASLILLVPALWLLGGCSGTACQDACEKRKKCGSSLDCSAVPPAEKAGCENARNLFASEDCSASKGCSGTALKDAEDYNRCELDNFCRCKASASDGPSSDILCNRPPTISACFEPPNQYSTTLWYCAGCGDCEGPGKTAACSLIHNNDCRFFATSCLPRTYFACDGTGPDQIQFLCGYCFFQEAGAAGLKECDKLSSDSGGVLKDAGRK